MPPFPSTLTTQALYLSSSRRFGLVAPPASTSPKCKRVLTNDGRWLVERWSDEPFHDTLERRLLGRVLTAVRKDTGLTMTEAETVAELPAMTVSRWENVGPLPDAASVSAYVDKLGGDTTKIEVLLNEGRTSGFGRLPMTTEALVDSLAAHPDGLTVRQLTAIFEVQSAPLTQELHSLESNGPLCRVIESGRELWRLG